MAKHRLTKAQTQVLMDFIWQGCNIKHYLEGVDDEKIKAATQLEEQGILFQYPTSRDRYTGETRVRHKFEFNISYDMGELLEPYLRKQEESLLPKIQAHPAVDEVFSEFGNLHHDLKDWWVHLKPTYCSDPETHVIHEQTLEAVLEALNHVSRCDCLDCAKDQGVAS